MVVAKTRYSHFALGQIGLVAPSGGTLVRATTLTEPVCRTAGFRGLQQAGDARRRQSSIQSGLISGSYETSVQH